MRHILMFSVSLAISLLGVPVLAEIPPEPTSEIPAKRDFPLNSKLKPCEDFHKYVCSNVENSFKLREDRSMHDFAFNDSSERILNAKKDFFSHITDEKALSPRDIQVRDFYLACMNEKEGKKQETDAIKKIQNGLSGIKTVSDFYDYNFNQLWSGEPSLFHVGIDSNKDNPKNYDILVMSRLMNLPEFSYYDNKDLMADYRKLIIEFFKIAEPKAKPAALSERADKLIALEKEFVKIYPHPDVTRQRWSEKRQVTQEEYLKKYSGLHLEKVISHFPEKLFVTNPIPESLDFMAAHLDDANLPVLKDFFFFSIGRRILDDSQPDYFQKYFEFNKKYLGGPNERPERNERCTREVMGSFNRELDAILMPRMFQNFPEDKVRTVAAKIKESILSGVSGNSWLSEESRQKALNKVKKARLYLIKPQSDKEWDFMPVKKYSDKHRIENEILHAKTALDKDVEDAKGEVNLEAWGMGPLTVNAYYEPSANKFVLPIGILQYPFFVSDGDIVENLGAVGTVFGHELGHGIDDQGAKYDEDGKLNQWMSIKEIGEFQTRGQKLVDYFNKSGHNGRLTLGENIADLVGITFAYNSAFPKGIGAVEDKQRFFVAYARLWCYKGRPKAEEYQLKTNPHSLGWARINEQMKHQPGFQEAFQCSPKDAMYLSPEQQVKIW